MLSLITAIIFTVLGILSLIYSIFDAAILKNNNDDVDLILGIVGFLLLSVAIQTYHQIWVYPCALNELLV